MGKNRKMLSRKKMTVLAAAVISLLLILSGILIYQQILSASLNSIRFVTESDYGYRKPQYACEGRLRVNKYKFYETDTYILYASYTAPSNSKKRSMRDIYDYMVFDSPEDAKKTYEWYKEDYGSINFVVMEGRKWFVTITKHMNDATGYEIYYLEENVIMHQQIAIYGDYSKKDVDIKSDLIKNSSKNYLLTHAASLRVRLLTDLKNDLPF